MSEGAAGAAAPGAAEAAAAGGPGGDGAGGPPRELRCSDCIVWNRQQTWLCVVPLFIGFIGLGLSLMLLKWIVVGSVKEYVPTELMDAKGVGQDPFFLSKPTAPPRGAETTAAATPRPPSRVSPRLTTMSRAPPRPPGTRGPARGAPRPTAARHPAAPHTAPPTSGPPGPGPGPGPGRGARPPPAAPSSPPLPAWPTAAHATSSYKIYVHDSAPSWTLSPFQESTTTTPEASTTPKTRKYSQPAPALGANPRGAANFAPLLSLPLRVHPAGSPLAWWGSRWSGHLRCPISVRFAGKPPPPGRAALRTVPGRCGEHGGAAGRRLPVRGRELLGSWGWRGGSFLLLSARSPP